MVKHALVYMVAFTLPGVLGFFSFSIYTHLLTPAEYGVYSVGASVAFLLGNVCYGWIRFSIARFQAEAHETNFIPFALICFGVTTVLVAPITVLGALFLVDQTPFVIAGILSMAVAQALFDITQEMRRARHQSIAFTRASVSRSMMSFCLSVSAAYLFARGATLLVGIAAGFLAIALLFLATNRISGREGQALMERPEVALVGRFLRYGMPLALSGLVFSGNSTIVRILVGGSLGVEAAGQFGAALDVTSQLCGMLAGSVCSIMGPLAIGAFRSGGDEAAREQLRVGIVLFLGLLAPTVAGFAVVAKPFADVISGPAFEGTIAGLIPLLALSRGLNVFAQYYLHLGFQIVEKPMRQVVCGSATLATNVVLNLVLTQAFGLMGAVWALVLSDFVGVLVSFALLRPVFPMPFPARQIASIAVAVAVMTAGCLLMQSVLGGAAALKVLLSTVAVGVSLYGGLAYAFDIAGVRSRRMISRGSDALIKKRL